MNEQKLLNDGMTKTFKLVGVLDEPFCVYHHYCDDVLFYIGSGKISRAFDCTRSKQWEDFRNDRPITVELIGFYRTSADARRAEYADIRAHRPCGNMVIPNLKEVRIVPSVPLATKVSQKHKQSKRRIICDPAGYSFATVSAASHTTGVPRSSIYKVLKTPGSSINGWYFWWKYF